MYSWPDRSGREAARERCDGDGVGGAAGEDDDVLAGAQQLRIDRAGRGERFHRAGGQGGGDGVGVLLAEDRRQSETQVFLAGDRVDDGSDPVDAGVRSGGSAGRDDQGDVGLACRRQQNVEIAFDRGFGGLGRAGSQVVGTGVGGAAVDGDRVSPELDAAFDRLGRKTPPSMPVGKMTLTPLASRLMCRRSGATTFIGIVDASRG
jgi:hypothetical protein